MCDSEDKDPAEMTERELTAEVGRIEVRRFLLEKQLGELEAWRDELLDELKAYPLKDLSHCVLCGEVLDGATEWDTGVCDLCAEEEPINA